MIEEIDSPAGEPRHQPERAADEDSAMLLATTDDSNAVRLP